LTAFFLLGAAWAVALPANGTYDEKDHIVRAYAVATGHLTTHQAVVDRRGDLKPAFLAPASLLPSIASVDCTWSPRPPKSASCQRWTTDRHAIWMPTGAARYSPVYYLPVGVALAVVPTLTGVVLARLVSALLSALLLACAVTAALRLGSRLLVVGIALVGTPMAMNLNGSVNPNGLEIAAGVLVFCALLTLQRAPADHLGERATRWLLALTAVGSLLLLTVRQIGPALLALDVVACALLGRPGRFAALVRRRDTRWILGGSWLVGLLFTAGWVYGSGFADIAPNARDARHLGLAVELGDIVTTRVPFYLAQAVGQFGYGETKMPLYALVTWYLLIGALVVPCLVLAGRRFLVVSVMLGLLSFGVLFAMDLYFLPTVGWFSQGRYAMASLVGVVLGPASAGGFEHWLFGRAWLHKYAIGSAAVVAVLHLYTLIQVMTRFQAGIDAPPDPFGGSWRPLLGPLPPLLAALAGGALLVGLVARAVHGHEPGWQAGRTDPGTVPRSAAALR
jgi:hypothetical protein